MENKRYYCGICGTELDDNVDNWPEDTSTVFLVCHDCNEL